MCPTLSPSATSRLRRRSRQKGRRRALRLEGLEDRVMLSAAATSTAILSSAASTTTTLTEAPKKKATDSGNWAGYAAATNLSEPQSGSVSAVSGSWTVPAVTGSGTAYSSVWVGIDGYSSSTVEQIGTESDVINGQPRYYAWYEMYPNGSVHITTMTVSPGDSISASVDYLTQGAHADQFQLTITDASHANDSFTTYQSAPQAQRSSAEWIVEAPVSASDTSDVLPLANFASVTFTNASATISGVTGPIDCSSWQATAINMVNSGVTTASTSNLTDTAGASSFTVTWVNSGGTSSSSSASSSTVSAVLETPLVPQVTLQPGALRHRLIDCCFAQPDLLC